MRRVFLIACILCLLLCGCGQQAPQTGVPITDAFGKTCCLPEDARIVSCYASFADMWLLSGGDLIGVTEDALSEHDLDVDSDISIVGTVKHIDLEQLVALAPDYVMLSADLSAHLSLQESLEAMGIPHGYFRVDVFGDYKALMTQFCAYTGREDLFETHVLSPESKIQEILAKIPEEKKSVLLLRAYSTGMKAKGDDNLAGQILREFGLVNIADTHHQLLEDLSLEHVVKEDPDFIFAMTMGNEAGALAYLEENAQDNPAWKGLSAIQRGNYHMLPKELFHYKPNERWSESYAYLASLIWPEIFPGGT